MEQGDEAPCENLVKLSREEKQHLESGRKATTKPQGLGLNLNTLAPKKSSGNLAQAFKDKSQGSSHLSMGKV